jgi:hypothetical protein
LLGFNHFFEQYNAEWLHIGIPWIRRTIKHGLLLYCTVLFQFCLDGAFAMRACIKVIFTRMTDGLIALTMNVIAICFTNAALWQRNFIPSIIRMNDFATHTHFIVACRGKLKRNVAHLAGRIICFLDR